MEVTNTDVLGYLHDAVLVRLAYEPHRDCRVLLLSVLCDPDAGHPDWNGRSLVVRFHDVYLANHFVFGAVTGDERLDAWTDKVSPSMTEMIDRLPTAIRSGIRFAVRFHSGSLLEGACQRAFIESVSESGFNRASSAR